MPGFDAAWAAAAKSRDGEHVSPKLRPLLHELYVRILANPKDLSALKQSLHALLIHLAGEGRTNANCWAADLFFSTDEGWESDWGNQELPEELHNILSKMSESLHDTVKAPHIAEDFGCLPEQLLTQLNQFNPEPPGT